MLENIQGGLLRLDPTFAYDRVEEVTPWGGGLGVSCPQQGDHPVTVHSAVPFAVEHVAGS